MNRVPPPMGPNLCFSSVTKTPGPQRTPNLNISMQSVNLGKKLDMEVIKQNKTNFYNPNSCSKIDLDVDLDLPDSFSNFSSPEK